MAHVLSSSIVIDDPQKPRRMNPRQEASPSPTPSSASSSTVSSIVSDETEDESASAEPSAIRLHAPGLVSPTRVVNHAGEERHLGEFSASDDEDEDEDEQLGDEEGKAQEGDNDKGRRKIPLLNRLSAFIPQLRAANNVLLEGRQRGDRAIGTGFKIRAVDDAHDDASSGVESVNDRGEAQGEEEREEQEDEEEGGQYIEMNLGLGVLEEQPLTPPLSPALRPHNPLASPPDSSSTATTTTSTTNFPTSPLTARHTLEIATGPRPAKKLKIEVLE